jgi:hypothetical protein
MSTRATTETARETATTRARSTGTYGYVEGLYGFREVASGQDSHGVLRVNFGMVYSPFD